MMKYKLLSVLIIASLLVPASGNAEVKMNITIDASDLPRKLLKSTISTTIEPDDSISFLYPKWIPGIHGPKGPVKNIGGLTFTDNQNQILRWQRDWKDVYRFYIYPQPNTKQCNISLTYICNQNSVNSKGVDCFGYANLGIINWNTLLLYPEGTSVRDIKVSATIILPTGWDYGSALPVKDKRGDTLFIKKISLEEFIDMPLITAVNMKHIEIDKTKNATYSLHIAAHDSYDFDIPDSTLLPLKNLVNEAELLFQRTHFNEYHFLLYLSDEAPSNGLEHRNSSLNGVSANSLKKMVDGDNRISYLLSHEFVHSWIGKYRRPLGMNTPDYMKDKNTDLLWVYEGLTEYLGNVLAARSGLVKTENLIDAYIHNFGNYQFKKGRSWRPIKDTELAAYTLRGGSANWSLLRRGQDYYGEGAYVWMEFDARIRNATEGTKSLNDFCAALAGHGHRDSLTSPLTIDEINNSLTNIINLPWDSLINERILEPQPKLNLSTFKECGFELTVTNEKSEYLKKRETKYKYLDFYSSLGFTISNEGNIKQVVPGSLADKAAMYSGLKIIALNNIKFSKDRITNAVKDTTRTSPLTFLAFAGDFIKEYNIDYNKGLMYPAVNEIKGHKNRLLEILSPLREIKGHKNRLLEILSPLREIEEPKKTDEKKE